MMTELHIPLDQREQLSARLLSVREVAELLHVHPNTLRQWSDNGLIGSYRLGPRGDRRFSVTEVNRMIAITHAGPKAISNGTEAGTENAQLLEKATQLSITDELTGLYNRSHLYEALETEISRTQRYRHPFSLAILGLDEFKKYTDDFGHSSGNAVLKSVNTIFHVDFGKNEKYFHWIFFRPTACRIIPCPNRDFSNE